MTKDELLAGLGDYKNHDTERTHELADQALLEYINDEDITKAFDDIEKWYS